MQRVSARERHQLKVVKSAAFSGTNPGLFSFPCPFCQYRFSADSYLSGRESNSVGYRNQSQNGIHSINGGQLRRGRIILASPGPPWARLQCFRSSLCSTAASVLVGPSRGAIGQDICLCGLQEGGPNPSGVATDEPGLQPGAQLHFL